MARNRVLPLLSVLASCSIVKLTVIYIVGGEMMNEEGKSIQRYRADEKWVVRLI